MPDSPAWKAFMAMPEDLREMFATYSALTCAGLPAEILHVGYMPVEGSGDKRNASVMVGSRYALPGNRVRWDYAITPGVPTSYSGEADDRARVVAAMYVWNALSQAERDRAVEASWIRPRLVLVMAGVSMRGIWWPTPPLEQQEARGDG